MHNRVLAKDIGRNVDLEITLAGWIFSLRKLGALTFLILRDRSGTAQVVLEKTEMGALKKILPESVVSITGKVKSEPRAPGGAELRATKVQVISGVTEEPPIVLSKKEVHASLDTRLEHRTIALRHPAEASVFKVQNTILKIFDEYFRANDFVEVKTPEIVGVATEGGTEVFEIKYFGKKAYLVQSPQLYKQIMVGVFERVFAVSRVFRAELHNTSRHLNESTQLDIEMGFIDGPKDTLAYAEGFFRALANELPDLFAVPKEIPSVTLDAAAEILKKNGLEDLSPEDERHLGDYIKEKHDSDVLFVTDYPENAKPFYILGTNSFDIIFKGMEICSGGQRIHDYNVLVDKMKKSKMKLDNFKGYLETFKFGMPPHGGWSIGLERLTMQLLDLSNIREASLFPRDLNRLEP